MQMKPKTSFSKPFNIYKLVLKILLPIVGFFGVIYILGQIELPAPNKLIKKEISNEKLITIK